MDTQIRPLIHIGFHKTGTSWLQDELFNNDSKVFHPISTLARHFVFDKHGFKLNSFDNNIEVITTEKENLLAETPISLGKIPVLSYERLSGSPFAGGVNASSHANRLKATFPDSKILIVIRNQQEAIFSAYFQYLTGGGIHSIKRFLNAKYNGLRPHFTLNHYCYHHIIEGYQHLFGKDNVMVLPYELFRDSTETYLSQLSAFVKVDIDLTTIDADAYRNKSKDHFVRYHFRFLGKYIKATELNDFPRRHNAFTKKIAWTLLRLLKSTCPPAFNTLTKRKVRETIGERIRGQFKESNQKTEALTGLNLSLYDYDR